MTTHHTICHKRFLEDPHKAAYDIWESSGFFLAANGAAMRTSVLGIVNFNGIHIKQEEFGEFGVSCETKTSKLLRCIHLLNIFLPKSVRNLPNFPAICYTLV